MKLVEILASEMEEWPEGVTHLTQSNVDREIYDARNGNKEDSVDSLNPRFDTMKSHTEGAYPIVTRAQWQAERDRQKGGEWKRHRGGRKQPIEDGVKIEVRWRNGEVYETSSQLVDWVHYGASADIMAFRVISQPQAEEVDVKDTTIGTLSYKVEIDTTVASQATDELAAKWDQVNGPLRWRDCVNELDAYIEEFTREREALINRLSEEGFALLPAMTAVMGVADSIIPIEDWQVGDILEVVARKGANSHEFEIGEHVRIDGFDLDDDNLPVKCYALDESDFWYLKYEEVKFIRRP